ncbi:uncharacterized protein LOC110944707 [Helianthus annuus]|uniref:uncharacterized protein LOC110944707 n=1 Tax=Helianthus annuus TaxID=4232 RepID=UPI000B8F3C14|nr:uncharacterized protein LOC110944707 [Helianthus annuus]
MVVEIQNRQRPAVDLCYQGHSSQGQMKQVLTTQQNSNKQVSIANCWDNGTSSWVVTWKRQPWSESDLAQWADLQQALQNIHPTVGHDNWKWIGIEENTFTVKDFKKQLADISAATMGLNNGGGNTTIESLWNSWIPMKVNFLIWRAVNERLLIKTALKHRGIPNIEEGCTWCNIGLDEPQHLFIRCQVARFICSIIALWCKTPQLTIAQDLFVWIDMLNNLDGSKEKRKTIKSIAFTTIWVLWLRRNEEIFKAKGIQIQSSVEDIKILSFLWVSNRSKLRGLT